MTRSRILAATALVAAAGVFYLRCQGRGSTRPGPARAPRLTTTVDRGSGDVLRIQRLLARPLDVVIGGEVGLAVEVLQGEDRAGRLRYRWDGGRGHISDPEAASTVWRAPPLPGRFTIRLVVSDDDGSVEEKVRLSVRLPSPREADDLALALREAAARDHQTRLAEFAILEAKLADLRKVGAQRESIEDRLRAQLAYEEMGQILIDMERYEDAREVYRELLDGVLSTDANYKKYSERYGVTAFFLGDEAKALESFVAAGPYCYGKSRYYMAELLEREGDRGEAKAAYLKAQESDLWFGDPVYRHALLELEDGATEDEIADLLVEASPRLDRDVIIDRLSTDDEMAPLWEVLSRTGRVDDLEEQRALEVTPGRLGDPTVRDDGIDDGFLAVPLDSPDE